MSDFTAPPSVRLLPMSSTEDPELQGQTSREVRDGFFLQTLPLHGNYNYHRRGIDAPKGTIVLFQHTAQIIASAVYLGRTQFDVPREDKGREYSGCLHFDPDSVLTFRPLDGERIRSIWPDFKGFNQSSQELHPPSAYLTFAASLSEIKRPILPDGAAATDSDVEFKSDGVDRRPSIYRLIRARRGQRRFRDALRERFGDQCMITGCTTIDALEAAHIYAFRSEQDHDPQNGLLLRSDIHTLFDLELIAINPDTLEVEVHDNISRDYGALKGTILKCRDSVRPSKTALLDHYSRFLERI
jgi:hypothetical protein